MTKAFSPTLLYEDNDLAAINKPAGVVVNDADTTNEVTIQQWWREYGGKRNVPEQEWLQLVPADFAPEFGTPEEIWQLRNGIVHRLDKDTSGVLLLAKNPGSLVALLAAFKSRQVHKTYTALVHGKFTVPEGLIDAPLGRASKDRKLFAVRPDGRPAQTKYKVLTTYSHLNLDSWLAAVSQKNPDLTPSELRRRVEIYQGFSLVECKPLTGRTHQLRVHLAHLQHPIVGDITYTGRKRQGLDPLWCPRQFLHAASLKLTHPRTLHRLEFTAPVPPDLEQALGLLSQA